MAGQDLFQLLFEASPMGIVVHSLPGGQLLEVNRCFAQMLGYTAEDLRGKLVSDITHPQDYRMQWQTMERALAENASSYSFEKRYIRKNGSFVWAKLVIALLGSDGGPGQQLALGIAEDISERRNAEAMVLRYQDRLRVLASELVRTEEQERRRLAQGLHDDVVQSLAICRFKTNAVLMAEGTKERQNLAMELDRLLVQSIDRIRSLIFELSPPVLHELGLLAALEWLRQHMYDTCQLECSLDLPDSLSEYPKEAQIFIFQAVRELLINVRKHAKVSAARVSLAEKEGELEVIVQDHGVGFSPADLEDRAWRRNTLGLFSLRERARALGGAVRIESYHGSGCLVACSLPASIRTVL